MSDRVELAVRELVAALRAEMAPEPEPAALLSIADAARLLNVSRTSLYSLMDAGELPSRHVGRRRLIPRAALEAYAEGRA
jgi:excisionase family DNA binding protein